jgi:hypothetical protein
MGGNDPVGLGDPTPGICLLKHPRPVESRPLPTAAGGEKPSGNCRISGVGPALAPVVRRVQRPVRPAVMDVLPGA